MVIKIYDKWLAAPLKCGTRFLDKLNIPIIRSDVNGFRDAIENPFMEIEWFVIRNPIEHLQSALHTECLPHIDNLTEIRRILDTFIEQSTGGTHYHRELYSRIYDFWCHRRYSFEFVELFRLSYTMDKKGYHMPFYPDDYNFGYYDEKWKTKEEIVDIIRVEFKEKWEILEEYARIDLHYFEKCQSRTKRFV